MSIIQSLQNQLKSTYSAYFQMQVAHWNVTGPCFLELHRFFGELYEFHADSIDTIAELIRQEDTKVDGIAFVEGAKEASKVSASVVNEYLASALRSTNDLLNGWGAIAKMKDADAALIDTSGKMASSLKKFQWMISALSE